MAKCNFGGMVYPEPFVVRSPIRHGVPHRNNQRLREVIDMALETYNSAHASNIFLI
jgi:hypothetical protein